MDMTEGMLDLLSSPASAEIMTNEETGDVAPVSDNSVAVSSMPKVALPCLNWHPFRTPSYMINRCLSNAGSKGVSTSEISEHCGFSRRKTCEKYLSFLTSSDNIKFFLAADHKCVVKKFLPVDVVDEITEAAKKFERVAGKKLPGTKMLLREGFAKTDIAVKTLTGLLEYIDLKRVSGNVALTLTDFKKFLAERFEGDPRYILRKSLNFLVSQKLLKVHREIVKANGKEREILIYFHRSLTPKSPEVHLAIEDARTYVTEAMHSDHGKTLKARRLEAARIASGEIKGEPGTSSAKVREKKKVEEYRSLMTFHVHAAWDNGYQPRLLRLHLFHQFLYYAVYAYEGAASTDEDEPSSLTSHGVPVKTEPTSSYSSKSSEPTRPGGIEAEAKEPTIYLNEVSWKRFMPPISTANTKRLGLSRGWFHFDDLFAIMPLSIFTQLVSIEYKIEGLPDYLNDPIKRHTLLKDLPFSLRCCMLHSRRFPLRIIREVEMLCGMGLISCGGIPKSRDAGAAKLSEEKAYFLHRDASVLDTTTSDLSYNCISPPISAYTRHDYVFDSTADLQRFWHHVHAVSFSTSLGHKTVPREPGTEVTTETRSYPVFKTYGVSVLPVEEVEAIEARRGKYFDPDRPIMCGDVQVRPGACGFHPCFYMYRRQHWQHNRAACVQWFHHDFQAWRAKSYEHVTKRCERLIGSWRSEVYNRGIIGIRGGTGIMPMKRVRTSLSAENMANKRRAVAGGDQDDRPIAAKAEVQMLPKRKRIRTRKPLADAIDLDVLCKRGRERYASTPAEINTFMRLKAVNLVVSPNGKLCISAVAFRDLMHHYSPDSRLKTAKQLTTLANREMQKRPDRLRSMVASIKQRAEIMNYARSLPAIAFTMPEDERAAIFTKVLEKFLQVIDRPAVVELPDSIEEFRRQFRLDDLAQTKGAPEAIVEANTVGHIRFSILQNVFCANYALSEAESTACMLPTQQIYNQFSDRELAVCAEAMIVRGTFATGKYGDRTLLKRKRGEDPQHPVADLASVRRGDIAFSTIYRQFFLSKMYPQIMDDGFLAFRTICADNFAASELQPLSGKACSSLLSLLSGTCLDSNMSLDLTLPESIVPDYIIEKILKKQKHVSSPTFNITQQTGMFQTSITNLPSTSSALPFADTSCQTPDAANRSSDSIRLRLSESEASESGSPRVLAARSVEPVVPKPEPAPSENLTGRSSQSSQQEVPKKPHEYKATTAKVRVTTMLNMLRTETLEAFPEEDAPLVKAATSIPQKSMTIKALTLNACKVHALYYRAPPCDLSENSFVELRANFERALSRLEKCPLAPEVQRWLNDIFDCGSPSFAANWAKGVMDFSPEQNAAADLIWEAYLKKKCRRISDAMASAMRSVVGELERAGCVGIMQQEFKNFCEQSGISMEVLESCLSELRSDGLVLRAGTTAQQFVSFRWCLPWLVRSVHNGDDSLNPSSSSSHNTTTSFFMVPKPWLKPDGAVNRPMLKWFVQALMLQILSGPGIPESELCRKMEPVLQHALTSELLELICELSFAERNVTFERKASLFGDVGLKRPKEIVCYQAQLNGQMRFHAVFSDVAMPEFAIGAPLVLKSEADE